MAKPKWGWEAHEAYVQEILELDSTICSGNKFYDPGDGVDRSHYTENDFPLIVDCKCTTKKSFSLKEEVLREWMIKAGEMGKRFAMPIRFESLSIKEQPQDYILLSLNDFVELLDKARSK